jgi:hypothetical protein
MGKLNKVFENSNGSVNFKNNEIVVILANNITGSMAFSLELGGFERNQKLGNAFTFTPAGDNEKTSMIKTAINFLETV